METNYNFLIENILHNLDAISDEVRTSSDRTNNVIPVPLNVATSSFGRFDNEDTTGRNSFRFDNGFLNLPQTQPNKEPLRLYGADNNLLCAQNDSGLNTHLSPEALAFSALLQNLRQNDPGALPLDILRAIAGSLISYIDATLNLLYNKENDDFSLTQRLISSFLDSTSVHNTQTVPLFDSSLNTSIPEGTFQDISSLSDNKTTTFRTSSFDELATFQVSNAPSNCVWLSSEAENRLINLDALTDTVGISNNRTNNVIPVPLNVATSSFGRFDNEDTTGRNSFRLDNGFLNLPQIQPNNEPLRLYGADNNIFCAQNDSGLNSHLSPEALAFSALLQNLRQNDPGALSLDILHAIAGSLISYIDATLNLLYNKENADFSVTHRLISSSSDSPSVHNTQTVPLFDSSLHASILEGTVQDISSSSDNKTHTLSTSSFDELATFQISNAPSDCVWPSSEAVINRSPLHSPVNTSSFAEIFFGEELNTCPNLTNVISTNTGAVPKTFCSNSIHPFEKPLVCKFCFKNKEPAYIYKTHQFKSENGIILCPILRNYICHICGVSGDFAHTIKYCPANPMNKFYTHAYLAESLATVSDSTEQNTAQLRSTPNSSLTQLPPSSYFENIKQQPLPLQSTEMYSSIQEQLAEQSYFINNQEVNLQNALFIPRNLSSSSNTTIRSRSPIIPYDRFTCASPSANIFRRKRKVCKFCRRNQEPRVVYNSHQLRDEAGRIECPYLRRFVCRICGATGDDAHTPKYCPTNTYASFIQKCMRQ